MILLSVLSFCWQMFCSWIWSLATSCASLSQLVPSGSGAQWVISTLLVGSRHASLHHKNGQRRDELSSSSWLLLSSLSLSFDAVETVSIFQEMTAKCDWTKHHHLPSSSASYLSVCSLTLVPAAGCDVARMFLSSLARWLNQTPANVPRRSVTIFQCLCRVFSFVRQSWESLRDVGWRRLQLEHSSSFSPPWPSAASLTVSLLRRCCRWLSEPRPTPGALAQQLCEPSGQFPSFFLSSLQPRPLEGSLSLCLWAADQPWPFGQVFWLPSRNAGSSGTLSRPAARSQAWTWTCSGPSAWSLQVLFPSNHSSPSIP